MAENKKYDFPTEVITLPSQGKCYPKEHPLASGEVEIKYMTAKEEEILASQNLIKKGIVLDKLFESIIADKTLNIDDIVIGDKNAIVLATRILGYGPEYKVQVPNEFDENEEITIDLSKVQTKDIDLSKLNRNNSYDFVTPSGKNVLKFKLLMSLFPEIFMICLSILIFAPIFFNISISVFIILGFIPWTFKSPSVTAAAIK